MYRKKALFRDEHVVVNGNKTQIRQKNKTTGKYEYAILTGGSDTVKVYDKAILDNTVEYLGDTREEQFMKLKEIFGEKFSPP